MSIHQLNFEGRNKVEVAVGLIQAFEPPDGYYLAFSGGEDSTVLLSVTELAGVKFDSHYCVSPIDPPQLRQHIKECFPSVAWDYYARGWWKMVVKKGLPTRTARWCCQVIKEAGGEGRVVLLGNRRDESTLRKHQKCFEKARRNNKFFVRPILDWNTGEIWEYIAEYQLPYCELYDKGFNRLGCVLCPFSREIAKEEFYFPKIVKAWKSACDRIAANRLASGKVYKHQLQIGQELYDWWVRRD